MWLASLCHLFGVVPAQAGTHNRRTSNKSNFLTTARYAGFWNMGPRNGIPIAQARWGAPRGDDSPSVGERGVTPIDHLDCVCPARDGAAAPSDTAGIRR